MNDDEKLGDELGRVQEILADAETTTRLSDWEQNFLDTLRERVLKYGDSTLVTPKQWTVIRRIEEKLYQ
jgi:hypothetical protein